MPSVVSMTKGAPMKRIARFALPIIVANALQVAYSLMDGLVVGRFMGTAAFAAIGATTYVYWLMLCLLQGMASGFMAVFAHRFGAGDMPGVRSALSTSIPLTAAIGLVLSALAATATPSLLRLLNTPADIFDQGALYLRILYGGGFLAFFYHVFVSVFYALGISKLPLYAMIVSAAVKLALSIALMACTPLGVAAVALATLAANLTAAGFCLHHLLRIPALGLLARDFRFDRPTAAALLKIGVPMGLRDFPSALVGLLMQYRINGYHTAFVAGIAAAKQLNSIMFLWGESLSAAIAPFVAQNFGAGQLRRIREGMRASVKGLLIGVALVMLAMLLFGERFIGFFIAGSEVDPVAVMGFAMKQLRVILICLPAYYLVLFYRAALRGLGNSALPLFSGLIEAALRVLILTVGMGFGQASIYLAEIIGWPFMAVQLGVMYSALMRREARSAECPIPAKESPLE